MFLALTTIEENKSEREDGRITKMGESGGSIHTCANFYCLVGASLNFHLVRSYVFAISPDITILVYSYFVFTHSKSRGFIEKLDKYDTEEKRGFALYLYNGFPAYAIRFSCLLVYPYLLISFPGSLNVGSPSIARYRHLPSTGEIIRAHALGIVSVSVCA